ncbi:MAG: hypothetical protein K9J30_10530 [Bacteroidales bacterium]|nr:hypothetical protein [Bacteroidales bacterium]
MKTILFGRICLIRIMLLPFFIMVSCTRHQIPDYSDVASCVGCHTNQAHLEAVASDEEPPEIGGCGGSAPYFPPYERVYMDEEGYKKFKEGYHNIGCTSCHGGVNGTHEKDLAHSGDFLKHPSTKYATKCGACHGEIAENFTTSLHNGTGQKRKVTMRMGLEGAHQFDELPPEMIDGYNSNCATCHGTCGNCHVNRPPIGGGGLANGHAFTKNPDMLNTCISCHTSRGGHAYLGVASGTDPDVHLDDYDFECIDCHNGMELHGNGDSTVTHRYAYSELPSCESMNCHPDVAASNDYHTRHIGDFNCQVCHSQDYNNCASCHIHGEGARVPAYLDFKIARNPIPETKPGFKYALVRRTLSAPDSWKEYGVDEYLDFNAHPTFNFTTPHNILRITSRTDVGDGNCTSKCHIWTDGDSIYNRNLYLFEDTEIEGMQLFDWDKEASADIFVNESDLPASWFN